MLVNLAARGAQAIFAAVVLALSVILIKDYGPGHNPSIIIYGAVVGAAALLFTAVGITAIFLETLQHLVVPVLDAVAILFVVAGAIAFTVQGGSGSCTGGKDSAYLASHKVFWPSLSKDYDTTNENTAAK